jgi:hypothetical protein
VVDKLFDDPRPIKRIWIAGPTDEAYAVGSNGVTKIDVYAEAGQMGYVPWFAIYNGGQIASRVNGAHILSVQYGE